MKRTVSLLLALVLLTSCFTAHAAEGYTTPINLRPRDNVYSVDYVFAVEGGESITAVTAVDSSCLLDWNYIAAEARLYISLASAQPLDTGYKLATVSSTARLTLTAESLRVNGVTASVDDYIPGDMKDDYVLTGLTLTDAAGAPLADIPRADFRAVVAVKNNSASEDSLVLLASYSADGQLLGISTAPISGLSIGSTENVGIALSNADGSIAELKAFCVVSLSDPTPLGSCLSLPQRLSG